MINVEIPDNQRLYRRKDLNLHDRFTDQHPVKDAASANFATPAYCGY